MEGFAKGRLRRGRLHRLQGRLHVRLALRDRQLSGLLTANHTPPTAIATSAEVTIEAGVGITGIVLTTEATVPGISDDAFQQIATKAKEICPVSRALAGVKDITLRATLKG